MVFGRRTLPALAPASPEIEGAAFRVHRLRAYALAALVILHVACAAKRSFDGDGTLRRMLPGASHPG